MENFIFCAVWYLIISHICSLDVHRHWILDNRSHQALANFVRAKLETAPIVSGKSRFPGCRNRACLGPLVIWFAHGRTSYNVLFLPQTPPPPTPFKNVMKIFYFSFSFHDIQIDSFAFLSLASIIVHLESALNSLYTLRNQSIILCEAKLNLIIADCLQNMCFSSFVFFTLNLLYLNAHCFHRYVVFSYWK